MYRKLEELIRNLKPGFYGQIEVGVQNGKPCQVRITESSRTIRGVSDERTSNRS
jgi:hypothetical protein